MGRGSGYLKGRGGLRIHWVRYGERGGDCWERGEGTGEAVVGVARAELRGIEWEDAGGGRENGRTGQRMRHQRRR